MTESTARACIGYLLFTTSVFTLPVQGSTPDEKWHHNVQNVIGRVAQVVSSDQVQLLLPDGEFIWVKMAGIKMPAGHDAFAANSRAWLASQINQQLVSADCVSIGKAIDSQPDGLHSRNIPVVECMVYPDDRDINYISLYLGYAEYEQCSIKGHNHESYRLAEIHARENGLGIWTAGVKD